MVTLEVERLKELSFEIGPIRPPSEGGSSSLLIRVTRNCPWSLCKFCYGTPYNREKFQPRDVEEVKRDIDVAKEISEHIMALAKRLGGMYWVSKIINPNFLYGKSLSELDVEELKNFECMVNVYNWLRAGAKTAFLQDADSLILPTSKLVEVISHLKQTFPSLERITCYARAKSLVRKSVEELKELREAGLSRLHVGLESGDDEVLKYVNKGVTSQELIAAGKKAKETGFELSLYWMPGLGGKSMSRQHALNTAKVLSKINPDFVRTRRFIPRKGTPLYEEWKSGNFQLLSPHEELREIGTMVEGLKITGRLCFDHFINPAYKTVVGIVWLFKQDYDGYKLPEEKARILEIINNGLKIDESLYVRAEELSELPGL
ncbi:MAG: radical SAM protein [Candidatus Nezhaarchaeales archaeon]|nr:MAG: radical SAM protein [Candidatus Nezhaarchaeota archaeon WYZ-LMO8]TDA35464.1 MAG: radical SAM protein [Candidatus Nezhaarchaeota archaeon WYZ-LMO7]